MGYAKVPYQLFDDLAVGKINNKQFSILSWLHRRAEYKTGVCRQVSAIRILAEMWGDDREQERPSERTMQEHLKRLDLMRYLISHHKQGSRGSYKVTLTNFEVTIWGDDGLAVSEEVLRPTETMSWEEYKDTLCGEPCAEPSGDVAVNLPVTLRSRCGDSSGDVALVQYPQKPTVSSEALGASADSEACTVRTERAVRSEFEFEEPESPASQVSQSLAVPELEIPVQLKKEIPVSATPMKEKSPAAQAANRFFTLLGSPKQHKAKAADWVRAMAELMLDAEMELAEYKEFLTYSLEVDPKGIQYITVSGNPIETLVKMQPNLLRFFRAYQKTKSVKVVKPSNLPENKPAAKRDADFLAQYGA